MKTNYLLLSLLIITGSLMMSCKESSAEKLQENIEEKSEALEDRSDDLDDAADYVESGFDNIEDAIENFRKALEEVDNAEDRKAIRKRINEIMDELETSKN